MINTITVTKQDLKITKVETNLRIQKVVCVTMLFEVKYLKIKLNNAAGHMVTLMSTV